MTDSPKPVGAGRRSRPCEEGNEEERICRARVRQVQHVKKDSVLSISATAFSALVLLSSISVCSAQPKLVGARLTWEVHPLFQAPIVQGQPSASVRDVTFTLTTAWNPGTTCIIPSYSQQVQELTNCPVVNNYGQLCVVQVNNAPVAASGSASLVVSACVTNAFTVTSVPTDLSLGGDTFAQGRLVHTVRVSESANLLFAYFRREASALGPDFQHVYNSDYWLNFPLAATAWIGGLGTPFVPTVVPLCTSIECPKGQSNLRNYYSPVPTLPLVVVGPPANTVQAPTFLKVHDLDGHKLQIRASYTNGGSGTGGSPESKALFFDIDPNPALANGPQVFFNTTNGVLLRTKRLEVTDRSFKAFQSITLLPEYSDDNNARWYQHQANVQLGLTIVDGSSKCTPTNPPPYFWRGSGAAVPLSSADLMEFSCPWNAGSFGVPPCTVPLSARSPLGPPNSTSTTSYRLVKITSAFGFPNVDARCSDNDCASNNAACCCGSRFTKDCTYSPTAQAGDALNPAGLGNPWKVEDIGKFFVTCFVASSELWDIGQATPTAGPCMSAPVCVKVYIAGRNPKFVDPTPLASNSYDMGGSLVPGRTDVGACLGYPLQLTIKAVDADAGDKVRIFVRKVATGTGNYDFLPSASIDPVVAADGCTVFRPYGAQRFGDNMFQNKIETIEQFTDQGVEFDSVMARMEANVSFTDGQAQQSIIYTLNLKDRNGVAPLVPGNTDGCDTADGIGVNETCRLLAMNMDQVICGAAYDNSRLRHRRWVGPREFLTANMSALFRWQRLNALGDLTTPQHCWRIRLQAPPRFVMLSSRIDIEKSSAVCVKPTGSQVSTCTQLGELSLSNSGFRNLALAVGQSLELYFVAADPNPSDQVSIFVMEDPGLPPNMKVGQSTCIKKKGLCLAEDRISGRYPDQDLQYNFKQFTEESSSPCSRAQLRLDWDPTDTDVGISFKICVIARDNSPLCFGQGPSDATSRGWFSRKECLQISVFPPKFAFTLSTTELHSFTPQELYVGCRFVFKVAVKDVTDGTRYGASVVALSELPKGAVMVRGAVCIDTQKRDCTYELIWSPKRGTEGTVQEVHFALFLYTCLGVVT
jgi:hypothetical protein